MSATCSNSGVSDPAVKSELSLLSASVGMSSGPGLLETDLSPEQLARIRALTADNAVLRPDEAPEQPAEIRRDALQIRAALEALENGDESQALQSLQTIPRSSVFADWKLLARGLAAYYRQDWAAMRANWDRLDPDRHAARIADAVSGLMRSSTGDAQRNGSEPVKRKLSNALPGGSALAPLRQLSAAFSHHDWDSAFRLLRQVVVELRTTDTALLQRLTRVLLPIVQQHGAGEDFEEFTTIAQPLPIDPHWNLAWAMHCEFGEEPDLVDAEEGWLDYLDDLDDVPCLSPTERNLARALVWERMGNLVLTRLDDLPSWSDWFGDEEAEEGERTRAIECFQNSLELEPALREPYEELASAYLDWEQPAEAAEVYQRMVRQFPDHFDALFFLSQHYHRQRDELNARDFAARAHRVKPLDTATTSWLARTHLSAAGHHARNKQWEKARDELRAVAKLDSAITDSYVYLAHQALLELKAKNADAGWRLVEQAEQRLPEPAPVYLVLAIEASRFGLPQKTSQSFLRQWKKALKCRCQGKTAGLMCHTMKDYLDNNPPAMKQQQALLEPLLQYVRRCSRAAFEHDDLRAVCGFLGERPDEMDAFERLVNKGIRRFRESAFFQYMAGQMQMRKGPIDCDRVRAVWHFERAVALARQSRSADDGEIAEAAKRVLTLLRELDDRAPSYGFGNERTDEEPDIGSLFDMIQQVVATSGMSPEEIVGRIMSGSLPEPIDEPTKGRSRR